MPRDGKRIKGTAAERARARDLLRDELLAAARALGEEDGGYDAVTIRKVADRVGYTAPVVYEHFDGKRALLLGVVEQGFADLATDLARAHCPEAAPGSEEVLHKVAQAYWDFAMERPHLYKLMSSLADVPFGTPATPAPAIECFRLLKAAVPPAAAPDEDAATDLFWAHLHGLVMLTLDGRIKGGRPRAQTLLAQLVNTTPH